MQAVRLGHEKYEKFAKIYHRVVKRMEGKIFSLLFHGMPRAVQMT
jgi:hypothetical protein